MGAESKSAPVGYLQQDVVDTGHRAGRDRNPTCAYSSPAALVLGAFVSDKFDYPDMLQKNGNFIIVFIMIG
jgi:hypothetical protein